MRSCAAIHWSYQRNLLFLEDYWRGDQLAVEQQTRTALQALVAAHPGIPLAALLDRAPGPPDDLYQLIAMEGLFVALRVAPLAEPAWVQVFYDEQTARSLSGRSPPLHEVLQAVRTGSNAAARDRLAQASPADLERALHRYTVLRPCLYGEPCGDRTLPARTLSRWLALSRAAEASYGAGLLGLIPRRHACGTRTPRVPEPTRLLMQDYIQQHYETRKQPRIPAVYGAFVRAWDARGLAPPTYATVCTYVSRQPRTEQIRKRQGDRAALPLQPGYLELTWSTPRHGERPFESCHIDHPELDIELVCSRTGRNLGRPWATFLSDAFSRRLLAVFPPYDAPSNRSCMMVIREGVRRHGRLPQSLIIDGGRECDSVYFAL